MGNQSLIVKRTMLWVTSRRSGVNSLNSWDNFVMVSRLPMVPRPSLTESPANTVQAVAARFLGGVRAVALRRLIVAAAF